MFDKSKFSADLIAVLVDMEAIYYRSLDVFKRFDTFSDEVNGLPSGTTNWPGTNLNKDDVLDLIIAAKEFTWFASNTQTVDPRDNLGSMARARNLQSS